VDKKQKVHTNLISHLNSNGIKHKPNPWGVGLAGAGPHGCRKEKGDVDLDQGPGWI
jgi:hypothetical protein